MDSSTAKFQFLDLRDATPDEIQLIDKILYGSTTAVQFPWSSDGDWDGETTTVGSIVDDNAAVNEQHEYEEHRPCEELAESNMFHELTEVGGPEASMITHLVGVPPVCTVPALSPLHGSPLLVSGTGLQPTLVSTSPDPAIYTPVPAIHSPMHHPYPMSEVIEGKNKSRRKRQPVDAGQNDITSATNEQHSVMSMPMNNTVPMQQLTHQGISYQIAPLQGHLQHPNMAATVTHSYPGPYYHHASSAILYTNNPVYNPYVPVMYSAYHPTGFMSQTPHLSSDRTEHCMVAMTNNNSVQKTVEGGGDDCVNIAQQQHLQQEEFTAQVPVDSELKKVTFIQDESEATPAKTTLANNIDATALSLTLVSESSEAAAVVTTNGCDYEGNPTSPVEEKMEAVTMVPPLQPPSSQPLERQNSPVEHPVVLMPPKSELPTTTDADKVPLIVRTETVNPHKSWASLFSEKNGNSTVAQIVVTTTVTTSPAVMEKSTTETLDNFYEKVEEVFVADTPKKGSLPTHLGELLSSMQLNHVAVPVVPRGLTNSGNWCYINATLQALLACPPFFNLMRQLPVVAGLKSETSPIPVIDSMVEFFHEFHTVPTVNKSSKSEGVSKQKDDLVFGNPFEPKYVYQMLRAIKSDSFKGRQEDAEEFLSCILNKLHEEMLELMASVNTEKHELKNGDVDSGSESNHVYDDGSDWLVMGHRNKGCVTRSVHSKRSPILEIFGGEMHSMLQKTGVSKSATLQPFFTLQLDIQGENVHCIKSALEGLVTKEILQGFTCGNTKQEVEASRKITLEKLPPVLILHLKRFLYDRNGGSRKLMKQIDFGMELELSKDLLSPLGKTNHKQRKFKLFAVVYHDGHDSAKGHYICDVYHTGYRSWLRTDDANIQRVSESNVLKHASPRVPYLLYYRNVDTIQ